ncbi:peptidoglycan DD-metalloendopeptidase family protein [Maribacter sp. MMG018]|uniref:peptidoglycan DD-metalloendopeptidase family protein n=1 Tax=Maribacter sp. MMG018 TaxID=2822688 RepID=UPI001B398959|nr:peptidoglycan DD-metalloendopeptidase family protein [Maribacter sp. MMG018]MBQ4916267.1 peptidoglycan DD-metalloendopeptidase family protein [Maribacter sp. MMG018]
MDLLIEQLTTFSEKPIQLLDTTIPLSAYVPLDLSNDNEVLKGMDVTQPKECQDYIDAVLEQNNGKVAYGGYLENRDLYADKQSFNGHGNEPRNVHLGIDYWCKAGTKVITPLDGVLHSFKNNPDKGDYGPTIILEHCLGGVEFYTLYGHLSLESLEGLTLGKQFFAGSTLGTLGTPDINVNYAPHLHFQIIKDIEGYYGDYPGVCSLSKLDFYKKNCPDPNLLLKIGS